MYSFSFSFRLEKEKELTERAQMAQEKEKPQLASFILKKRNRVGSSSTTSSITNESEPLGSAVAGMFLLFHSFLQCQDKAIAGKAGKERVNAERERAESRCDGCEIHLGNPKMLFSVFFSSFRSSFRGHLPLSIKIVSFFGFRPSSRPLASFCLSAFSALPPLCPSPLIPSFNQ